MLFVRVLRLFFLLLAAPLLIVLAAGQSDNFDDGDTNGWTELDSIRSAGGGQVATFSVTNGAYRLQAAPSPSPSMLGPGRAAALRQDVTYNDSFFLSVDIIGYDATEVQGFGLLAMVQRNPGPGSVGAYSFTFNPVTQDVQLARVVNEVVENEPFLALRNLTGVASSQLRITFLGQNGRMRGVLYNLSDLSAPIAIAEAFDRTYIAGTAGLVISNFAPDRSGAADATFDNYLANETGLTSLTINRVTPFDVTVDFANLGTHLNLERSTNLAANSWQVIPRPQRGSSGTQLSFELDVDPATDQQVFFRLRTAEIEIR